MCRDFAHFFLVFSTVLFKAAFEASKVYHYRRAKAWYRWYTCGESDVRQRFAIFLKHF